MHKNLIILAGGASSRMKKATSLNLNNDLLNQANTRSKGLICIDGKGRPLMDYLLYNAKEAGYKSIYIVIGETEDVIQQFYGIEKQGNKFNGLTINYAVQTIPENRKKPFGTADAVKQTLEQYPGLSEQTYTVCNSDNLYSIQVLCALRTTESPNAFISYDIDALLFSKERVMQFALVALDENNVLIDIIEKPTFEESELYKDASGKLRVSMNIFKFNGLMFNDYVLNCPVSRKRDEKELPTALLNMIKDYPGSVVGIPASEHVPDLTSKEDIQKMKEYIEIHYPDFNWRF
ncbi:NTP transferase domain-containing protein [Flavobacteriaceae bacterium R38]|nr:NTP transferase domain-containing protein [Flavobacteriaceae bacterium R38]